MTTERVDPPTNGPEVAQLRAWLGYQRDTLRLKCDGLDAAQLAQPLSPSTLTLGGLLKHLALVEDHWFSYVLAGNEPAQPWGAVDWEADPDFEFRVTEQDTRESMLALFDDAVTASDRILDVVGADASHRSARKARRVDDYFDLRWILVHMIEEYARHNGHADLIRESIDGSTGE